MPKAHDPGYVDERLRPLIELARREGWEIRRISGGGLYFVKPGRPPVFTASRSNSHRFLRKLQAQRQRVGSPEIPHA